MQAFPIFAILFLLIPIIEIYFLIQVGSVIGAGWTIFLVVATAVIGAALLRQQGVSTFARFQQNVSKGQMPAQELIEGVILLIGGALLMTPGFFTDTIGFLCLFPLSRQAVVRWLVGRATTQIHMRASGFSADQQQQWSAHTQQPSQHPNPQDRTEPKDKNVYEGEFTRRDDDRLDRWN